MTNKTRTEFVKFGLLRVLSFFISLALMYLLHRQLKLNERAAYYITLLVLLLISYVISAIWIFRKKIEFKSFLRYFEYIGIISLLSVPFFEYLNTILNLHYLVSTAFSLGAVFLLKFFLLKKNIFIDEIIKEDGQK